MGRKRELERKGECWKILKRGRGLEGRWGRKREC
jgi:hypothetical protein